LPDLPPIAPALSLPLSPALREKARCGARNGGGTLFCNFFLFSFRKVITSCCPILHGNNLLDIYNVYAKILYEVLYLKRN
jgi:hypothetical protein